MQKSIIIRLPRRLTERLNRHRMKGITIGLGRIKDCTVTPLFLASNLNLRPMGFAWFRFPWSAVYITATSAWPPNLLLYRTTAKYNEDNSSRPSLEPQ